VAYLITTTWYANKAQDERRQGQIISVFLVIGLVIGISLGLDLQGVMPSVISWTLIIALASSTMLESVMASERAQTSGSSLTQV